MRKLPFSILKRFNILFRREYSIVSRMGMRLLLNKYNWIDNRLLCYRSYEKDSMEEMKKIIDKYDIKNFIDIGANIGLFSVYLLKNSGIKYVYAFEPLPHNYYQLCSNLLLNKCVERVKPYMYALGSDVEDKKIYFNLHSTGTSTLDTHATQREYEHSTTVKCCKLDGILSIKDQNLLIKIDVEGYELQALKGMVSLLSENNSVLFIEINQHVDVLTSFLSDLGYEQIKSLDGNNYIFSNFK